MSDRVTQIQQCAGKLSEIFFTSVGVLQRDATLIQVNPDIPITAWTPEQLEKNTIDLNNASSDIIQTIKVIDYLIDSLPGIDSTKEDQEKEWHDLELENEMAGFELDEAIKETISLLNKVKESKHQLIKKLS